MEVVDPNMVTAFYHALDSILHLQYGKVLLATAPRNHLERVLERGWPYFTNISHHVSMCLNGTNCQGALDLVNSLGRVLPPILALSRFCGRGERSEPPSSAPSRLHGESTACCPHTLLFLPG